jgi:DNA-binding transcriptional LysR family regulator
MTLEQLRIFVGVAEREHMTAAARALNVTQSAASAAIAALEERHAIKLFHRVGRGITLTEAGRLFLAEARGVLARAGAAETVLDELGGLKRGTLRVVASQTIAAYWLPPILAKFRALYPTLGVELAIGNTEQAAARVRDGYADLGIVEGEVDDPALAHWPIGEDRLLLIGAEPFGDAAIDAAWLREARWVQREPGSGTRSTLDRYLLDFGVPPRSRSPSSCPPTRASAPPLRREPASPSSPRWWSRPRSRQEPCTPLPSSSVRGRSMGFAIRNATAPRQPMRCSIC